MAIKIRLTISIADDFHIGTGTGRGRATDAVVLVDERHVPFVPGSALKGLCKWQACRLLDAYPALGPKPEPPATGPVFEIFGGGTDLKHAENRVWFDHAYPEPMEKLRTARVGRSSRDRVSGRARDRHLFFYEDASPAKFSTTLTCDDNLSPAALLLLILSLRRIEALGGQRRRGKGRCSCRVQVLDPGTITELAGLDLPSSDGSQADRFRRFAKLILGGSSAPLQDAADEEGHASLADTKPSPAPETTRSEQACWMVFGFAESPLTLGHDQAVDNTIPSEDFISGASVRGALAWQAIRSGLSPDSVLFQQAFVREKVHFGPLYPALPEWKARTLPMPMPASFQTCKRYPGAYSLNANAVHGVVDRLHNADEACISCGAALKPADGYFQLEGDADSANIVLGRPPGRVFQRTAIDESTQRGKDNQLYSLESIQRGTYLAGYVWGPQPLLEQVFRDRCEQWTTIRVGKAKSRGQGVVEIFVRPATADEHPVFPRLLPADWPCQDNGASGIALSAPFCITLYSDLIAIDNLLRPVTRLTADELWRLLDGQGDPPFELERGFVTIHRVGGFIGVIGLPRSPDLAIAAGSTWRFRWRNPQDAEAIRAAWDRLLKVQASGLGLRLGEGYGRFVLDLPLQQAGWNSMALPSHPVACATTALPFHPSAQKATVERARWMHDQVQSGEKRLSVEYQRLFAELAQQENPIRAVRALLDDPLHRQGKAKNLPDELQKLGFSVVRPPDANQPEAVERFRDSLKIASGETS